MATTGLPISPRERGWIIATVMLGTVSTITAATIINVAFPALIGEFHVGHDTLQWVAAGFLGAMTTTMLATAWLVETHGQRRTFIAALAIFLASSALGAASFGPEVLIASRVLQGAAAGILQPLAMIALFEVFPPERRGSAMGLFGLGIVLVPAIGPSIGGILLETFGWRSIFLLPLPFCVAGLLLGWRFLPGPRGDGQETRFDWAGFARMAAGRARHGRRGNGLSRMLRGGYDCVCGRDWGRLVDPQASTGQRYPGPALGGPSCIARFSSPITALRSRAWHSTKRCGSRRTHRSKCILPPSCTTLRRTCSPASTCPR